MGSWMRRATSWPITWERGGSREPSRDLHGPLFGDDRGDTESRGAYVPIDPEYPKERIGYMLEDTGARVVLSNSR